MTGRRRYPRFLLSAPVDGTLDVREEVAIERWGDDEVEVISLVPCRPDEQLSLELPGDSDGLITVTVVESRAVVAADGSIRYRLRMSFEQPTLLTAPDEGQRQS